MSKAPELLLAHHPIIGDEPADIDETLLRNIGRAHRYFDRVRSGKTFGEIAGSEGVSKRRIQQLIELAFLAPDVVGNVRDGKQPVGLTSDWLMRHAFTPIWLEQRKQFVCLRSPSQAGIIPQFQKYEAVSGIRSLGPPGSVHHNCIKADAPTITFGQTASVGMAIPDFWGKAPE